MKTNSNSADEMIDKDIKNSLNLERPRDAILRENTYHILWRMRSRVRVAQTQGEAARRQSGDRARGRQRGGIAA